MGTELNNRDDNSNSRDDPLLQLREAMQKLTISSKVVESKTGDAESVRESEEFSLAFWESDALKDFLNRDFENRDLSEEELEEEKCFLKLTAAKYRPKDLKTRMRFLDLITIFCARSEHGALACVQAEGVLNQLWELLVTSGLELKTIRAMSLLCKPLRPRRPHVWDPEVAEITSDSLPARDSLVTYMKRTATSMESQIAGIEFMRLLSRVNPFPSRIMLKGGAATIRDAMWRYPQSKLMQRTGGRALKFMRRHSQKGIEFLLKDTRARNMETCLWWPCPSRKCTHVEVATPMFARFCCLCCTRLHDLQALGTSLGFPYDEGPEQHKEYYRTNLINCLPNSYPMDAVESIIGFLCFEITIGLEFSRVIDNKVLTFTVVAVKERSHLVQVSLKSSKLTIWRDFRNFSRAWSLTE